MIAAAKSEPEFTVSNPDAPISQDAIDIVAALLLDVVDGRDAAGESQRRPAG